LAVHWDCRYVLGLNGIRLVSVLFYQSDGTGSITVGILVAIESQALCVDAGGARASFA
jgi:hypothetical protein